MQHPKLNYSECFGSPLLMHIYTQKISNPAGQHDVTLLHVCSSIKWLNYFYLFFMVFKTSFTGNALLEDWSVWVLLELTFNAHIHTAHVWTSIRWLTLFYKPSFHNLFKAFKLHLQEIHFTSQLRPEVKQGSLLYKLQHTKTHIHTSQDRLLFSPHQPHWLKKASLSNEQITERVCDVYKLVLILKPDTGICVSNYRFILNLLACKDIKLIFLC